jgi:hypothetical protein
MTTHHCPQHKRYGLTCDQFDQMVTAARGRCTCCDEPCNEFLIDHDHTIGPTAVRGLVCHLCNIDLGRVDAGVRTPSPATAAYLRPCWVMR